MGASAAEDAFGEGVTDEDAAEKVTEAEEGTKLERKS
jgi:hypothetical protein